ncbi:hypothetical protein EJ05DRAFT_503942 [Pseudovirgaria hyperparasitica]|uniref:Zn(2)-C6 fungal-type domain-containing protein n=1 Tax=Pseudovirgaria hyperparasitica TaxID=470096 RepID=A0A6A6VX74_9PEZI|nr:uncharacterized protein EJ05DRAFT_503942 [Pseudovirgaria hyperparasitica]KAF2754406.1 hypothetical protein EJ05DRAFT_503942 [Pseudovirgaria hyperparasitica]
MNPITPTTPNQARNGNGQFGQHNLSPTSLRAQNSKRARDSDDGDDGNGGTSPIDSGGRGLKQPAIKRACNECRQQKLRCDVQQDPFVPCSRCRKHKLTCLIEPNFKRVGKRSRHAEMEREIAELKQQVSRMSGQPIQHSSASTPFSGGIPQIETYNRLQNEDEFLGPHQAVASLLDLRGGSPSGVKLHALGELLYAPDRVNELFKIFFDQYHPYLPFLDPDQSPDQYLKDSRLLFWTIIAVAARKSDPRDYERMKNPLTGLLWGTIAEVPGNHHVVKALCLHCTWPLPTDRTSTDITFMLCGLMMQVAMQIGLHQPAHADDFSRYRIQLQREDIDDRTRTWAVCNIVAQSVSTGYGQPPNTEYDSTLKFIKYNPKEPLTALSPQLFARLRLEMAADRIVRNIYANHVLDESGNTFYHPHNQDAPSFAKIEVESLFRETLDMEPLFTDIEWLYQKAVHLHLRLYSFFDTTSDPRIRKDLLELYNAATSFIDQAMRLHEAQRLHHAPNIIFQMLLAAGFALLKLCNSDYTVHYINCDSRKYFSNAVRMARCFSTKQNDLPMRLCEVLAQLWKESGSGGASNPSKSNSPMAAIHTPFNRQGSFDMSEDAVRLKVRSRMSMSVVFDSVWRWRETHVKEQLETAVQNPTNPDSSSNSTPPPGLANTSGADLSVLDGSLGIPASIGGPAATAALNMPLGMANGLANTAANSYEFFDPVSWVLDFDQEWNTDYNAGFPNFPQ